MSSTSHFASILDLLASAHDDEVAALHAEIERLRASLPQGNQVPGVAEKAEHGNCTTGLQNMMPGPSSSSIENNKPPTPVPVNEVEQFNTFTTWRTPATSCFGRPHRSHIANVLMGESEIDQISRFAPWVTSPAFEGFFAFVVVVNVAFMAVEMQYRGVMMGADEGFTKCTPAKCREDWPGALGWPLSWVFGIMYILEAALKIPALRWAYFKEKLHWVDLFLVLIWMVNVYGLQIGAASSARLFRLAKILRLLKVFRTFPALDSLAGISTAITCSLHTLVWSLTTFVILLCFFAMMQYSILESFYIQDPSQPEESRREIYRLFGTFSHSLLTMFELTFANWIPVTRTLSDEVSVWYAFFAVLFKMTLGFAVVAVVNGVFIQETFKSCAEDLHIKERQKDRADKGFKQKIKRLFEVTDSDSNGKISHAELDALMSDGLVKKWMALQGLPSKWDSNKLFSMLDSSNSGELSKPDFLKGFASLKGAAENADVKFIIREVALLRKDAEQQSKKVDRLLERSLKGAFYRDGNHLPEIQDPKSVDQSADLSNKVCL